MKQGLFFKMMVTFIIIITSGFVVTASVLSLWFQSYYYGQRENQLMSEAPYIESIALDYMVRNVSQDTVEEKLKYFAGYSSTDILLVNYYGLVYSVSNDKYKYLEGKQIVTDDLNELRKGQDHLIDSDTRYKNVFKTSAHVFIKPIFSENEFKGAIMMVTSLDDINQPLKKVYNIIWFCVALCILCSSFIIYYFFQKNIIRPLSEINTVAGKITRGEVGKRVVVKSKDEIGMLATSFNSMADTLEHVDNNRKSFISNVSHELRSPITSIKGFIGGIIDGVIPPEKEKYYLTVTYEEIQRLTRLVNDLLDLSAIESGQLKLNMSVFDLNELLKQCIIKFETQINEKMINLDARFEGDNLYVYADKDRIIQVVVNLLDNAVKYVSDGGFVRISTRTKANKAYVSIFNNGPTIPEEDVKHIWDRFYKGDKSRTLKNSTGLGLPIVRSTLTEHGEDVWAENKIGEGVTFVFTLKRA